jgi:cobalt/nickel transport system permease protein
MHIPDGFLDTPVWVGAIPVATAGVAYALRRSREDASDAQVPLLGVVGAFVFAAQMINFPVAPGASGHLAGGVLAAMLLGPHAAAVVMTVVLTLQCLVFQDGGVTALATNIVNLALIATYAGYGVATLVGKLGGSYRRPGIAIGAWLSVMLASAACATELALSNAIGWTGGFTAILGVHAVIGLGEAAITVGILSFVSRMRPDLLFGAQERVHETA